MSEFYVVMNSNAAPILSDASYRFLEAATAEEALATAREEYNHPCGLYAVAVYADANAERKGADPLARWFCPKADRRTNGAPCKCGRRARLVVGNHLGYTDVHECECGARIAVDAATGMA